MKILDRIEDDFIEVRFLDNWIQCFNLKTNQIVAQMPYNKPIEKVEMPRPGIYFILNQKNEYISTIWIFSSFVDEICKLLSNAGYILDLQMLTAIHGFYFGYYEIGEFLLENSNKLVRIKSYPIHVCIKGRATASKQLYLSVGKDGKYVIEKLDWNRKEAPIVIWECEVPSAIMAMEMAENYLFIGMKDGTIQVWDIYTDNCLEKANIFTSEVSLIKIFENFVIVGSKDGEVASISNKLTVQWKIKPSTSNIVGIYKEKNELVIIDTNGKIFQIDSISGKSVNNVEETISKGKLVKLVSDFVTYRNEFVITGYGGIWYISTHTLKSNFQHYMNDPLIRILKQHPFGFYSGDDEGIIRFWSLGKVEIKMEHYDPPLKETPKLDEVFKRLLGIQNIEKELIKE